MAVVNETLIDSLTRSHDNVHTLLDGLSPEQLAWRPTPEANPIGWLVWHLTRVQDDHVAELAGADQVWEVGGWADRFDLPYDRAAHGYGQSAEEVGAFHADTELLLGYLDAVHSATVDFVGTLQEEEFARVVDDRWDPPVTLGVRLVSVIDDCAQHTGQAAYVRGILPDA